MGKKITLADIKNQNKVYEQKQKVELSDGNYLFIYPNFSPTKMAELIKEVVTEPQLAKDKGIDFDKINTGDWYLFNIICKFSDLVIPSNIEKKVQAFKELIDWEYFGALIDSFPKESIKKLDEAFTRFKENFEILMKENGLVTEEKLDELIEIEQ
jgi:hypothetical protein